MLIIKLKALVAFSSMKAVLVSVLLFSSAAVVAQESFMTRRVTLKLAGITFAEALTVLEISYGAEFSYSDDLVPAQDTVDLIVENETLPNVLESLLKPFGIDYKISRNRILLKRQTRSLTQTIRGKIYNESTSAPVAYASISVRFDSTVVGGTSSENGEFRIEKVPLRRVTLIARCLGYETRTVSNVLLTSGKEVVIDIPLVESQTTIQEVIVTGLKNDGIPGEGMAVTSGRSFVVEDTRRYAGSLGDPARMVTAFAGVTGASDESNGLIVRGNSPRGVLWRVDGIEIPNPNHFTTEGASSGVMSVLSPNMIESFDFITGAFPAQFGNALSAVFDVNLRSGNNERHEHSFQIGTLGIEASAEGPFSNRNQGSYLVNYRYSTLSVLDKFGVDINAAGEYKDYQDIGFKLKFPGSKNAGTFSVFGLGGSSQSNRSTPLLTDNNRSAMGVLGTTYRKMVNESTIINAAIALSGTAISRKHEIGGLDEGPLRVEESYAKSYWRSSISLRKKIAAGFFIEGGLIYSRLLYDFYLRNRDPENSAYQEIINFQEDGTTSITQGFLYNRQYLSPRLFAFYGFHVIRFDLTKDTSWEPRAGLRWRLKDDSFFSVAFGKHSRVENLQYYLARDHQLGGDEVQINKRLGATRAGHLVLSYERSVYGNHRLKSEVYHQWLSNVPVHVDPSAVYAALNEDTGFITDTLVNNGKGRNYGAEISLESSFSRDYYYGINASLFESVFSVGEVAYMNTAYNGNYSVHLVAGREFELPRSNHRLGFNIKVTQAGGRRYIPIDLNASIDAGTQVYNWQSAFDSQMPGYFRADMQVVFRTSLPHYALECRLDIQNVTNHRNAAYYFFDSDTQTIRLKRQVGLLPVLSFKVEF